LSKTVDGVSEGVPIDKFRYPRAGKMFDLVVLIRNKYLTFEDIQWQKVECNLNWLERDWPPLALEAEAAPAPATDAAPTPDAGAGSKESPPPTTRPAATAIADPAPAASTGPPTVRAESGPPSEPEPAMQWTEKETEIIEATKRICFPGGDIPPDITPMKLVPPSIKPAKLMHAVERLYKDDAEAKSKTTGKKEKPRKPPGWDTFSRFLKKLEMLREHSS
jgi:hypothetical protein